MFERVMQVAHARPYAKTLVVAERLLHPGPPLNVALQWIGPLPHRAAVATFLAGDWFLGRYAANY